MRRIKNLDEYGKYEELEFEDSLWEIIDIPEKVYRSWYGLDKNPENSYLTQTLHYIGPVVNGEVVCTVPAMDFQYHTFAGCVELREIPEHFYPVGFWEPFYGCSNLNPSIEKIRDFQKRTMYCSEYRHGNLFDGCGSPYLLIADTQESFFVKLTGYDLQQFSELRDWVGDRFDRYGVHIAELDDLTKILNSILQQGLPLKDTTLVTSGAGIVEIKHISKMSEIPVSCWSKEVITPDFVIACSCSGAVQLTDSNIVFVGIFAEDFVNDTMDSEILSVRPQAVHGNISGSIIATNSEIVFDGDCIVEAENAPAIIAEGILTLRGSGSILLKSSGMHSTIGIETYTGMSYGRWCPGNGKLTKIMIDGVQVRLESAVPNFTIGSYGTELVPEIELNHGGTLDCPEMRGKRLMKQSGAESLYGSTKRSSPAIYEISEPVSSLQANPVNAFL